MRFIFWSKPYLDMDTQNAPGHGGQGGELSQLTREHIDVLQNTLEINEAFLIALCCEGLLDLNEAHWIHHSSDQTKELLRHLEGKTDRGAAEHFLRALERTDQYELAIRLTSFDREMRYVAKWHSKLAHDLDTFMDHLVSHERKFGMKPDLRKLKLDDYDTKDTFSLLRSAKTLLNKTCTQVGRSSSVLIKLNQERSTGVIKTTDNLSKVQECEGLLRAVFPAEARRIGRNKPLIKLTDESERAMRSIRDITKECQGTNEKQRHLATDCSMTIERLKHLVKNRVSAIEKIGKPENVSPKPTPRSEGDTPRKNIHRYSTEGVGFLLEELDLLEKELQKYMSHEKGNLNKLNVANLQLKLMKIHLDTDDIDLKEVEKEVNAANKQSTLVIIRSMMSRVHKERKETLASLVAIEKLIDGRIALIEKRESKSQSPKASPKEKKGKPVGDKNSLPAKSKVVLEKVKEYSNIEKGISSHHLADFAKQRRAMQDEITTLQNDVELLEEMAKRFEGEKEKYKRLYDTERVVKHKDSPRKKHEDVRGSRYQRRVGPVWNSHTSLESHHRRPLPATFNQYLSEKGQLRQDSKASWEKQVNGHPVEKKVEKVDKKPNKCATS